MKVACLGNRGLEFEERTKPKPSAEQVLVQVHAAGLNRIDLLTLLAFQKGTKYGNDMFIGRDFSGTVAEVGPGVKSFKIGDPVMCTGKHTFAQFALADEHLCSLVPLEAISMEEAAALPIALNTVHDALITWGKLRAGQSVLVQGASSAVGLMAMQIAKQFDAEIIVGMSRNPARRERLTQFGANIALDPTNPRWVEAVLEKTNGKGVDLIIDQVGPPLANDNMRAAALEGRIINVGRLGGNFGDFDFDLHALRRITYIGVTFRTRSLHEVREIKRLRDAGLFAAIKKGFLKLPVDSVFAFEDLEKAFSHMKHDRHFGKIVVQIKKK